ncbi:hemicentin-1-like [Galleria mellonella]|uniref:Hemicentin-1-like n=1 Tax=Galleria mellonella TaxID=7137 RepID=A0A6J1WK37_GALME|nr:hemicentin-1-like [Galleria mellonella]
MLSKLIIICFIIKLVSSRSFTIVVDTTDSMEIEINIIKANIASVLNVVRSIPDIENYVIVPFNDPDVGIPIVSESPDIFLNSIYTISTSGGTDCPENSLAGIRKGLEVSKDESHIFVFTDAFAKDYNDIDAIKYLCQTRRSKVIIFLSGFCRSNETSLETYKSVAEYCSGVILQLNPARFRESFRYMKEIVPVEWNNILTLTPSNITDPQLFSVENYTTDVMITITGEHPSITIKGYRSEETVEYEVIVHSDYDMVIRVKAKVGLYTAVINCRPCSAKLYKRNKLPFQYGFSTRLAKDIRETTDKPLPDTTSYIIISIPANIRVISIKVELIFFDNSEIKSLSVKQFIHNPGFYFTNIYMNSKRTFRITIHVLSGSSSRITGSTGILQPQKLDAVATSKKPSIEMIDSKILLDFDANVTIPAKIKGYPKPDIWWENNDGERLKSETILLEIPYVYMSYVTVYNIMANTTIYCKSRNSEGEESQAIELFVNRSATLEVLRTPDNETFEYGTEGKLYCEISAYPEAIITWYHNDTVIDSNNFDNLQIVLEDNALLIKNMSFDNVGEYKCLVSNTVETKCFTATVQISGLEFPQVAFNNSEIILQPTDIIDIECWILEGKPEPAVSWTYKSDDDFEFNTIPDGVDVVGRKLRFSHVNKKNEGTYKCEAKNILGTDSKELSVKLQYAPVIKSTGEDTLTVRETKLVELQCEVDAIPAAEVRWETSQDDVIVPSNPRHTTDDYHTLRFVALMEDSGNYYCIAENKLGRAQKTVRVNVLVPPYIRPEAPIMDVRTGETAMLVCNVQTGNPAPMTRWEFLAPDSTNTVLQRGNATNTLVLYNVNKNNEGYYVCIAYNNVGTDRIKTYLRVY